jgi:acyl-coenzyme A thioesterase PaaI-like protein
MRLKQDEKEESDYLETIKERINKSPVYRFLGMKVAGVCRGFSRLELDCREKIKNMQGLIHLRIICNLIDASCGVALESLLKPKDV